MSELNFIQRLIAVQNELKSPKNQYNKFGKYRYRSCEDILEALKPLLQKYGLLLTLNDEIVTIEVSEACTDEKGCRIESDKRVYVKATATVTDGDKSVSADGSARESMAKKGMDASQVTGTASSYARKYALNGLFLIDDSKDDDTREPTDVNQSTRQSATQAPQPTQPLAVVQNANGGASRHEVLHKTVKARILEAEELGVKRDGIYAYAQSKFGKSENLSDEELIEFGKHIRQLIEDKKELANGRQ